MSLSTRMRKPSRVGIVGLAVTMLLAGNTIHNTMQATTANEARERAQAKALVSKHDQALAQAEQMQQASTPPPAASQIEPMESTLDDVPLVLHRKDANGNVTVR